MSRLCEGAGGPPPPVGVDPEVALAVLGKSNEADSVYIWLSSDTEWGLFMLRLYIISFRNIEDGARHNIREGISNTFQRHDRGFWAELTLDAHVPFRRV